MGDEKNLGQALSHLPLRPHTTHTSSRFLSLPSLIPSFPPHGAPPVAQRMRPHLPGGHRARF